MNKRVLFSALVLLLLAMLPHGVSQSYKPRISRNLDAVGSSGSGSGSSLVAGPSGCIAINTTPNPDEIDLAAPVMPCRTYIDNSDAQTVSAAATTIDTTARSVLLTNSSGGTLTISNTPSFEAGEYAGQLLRVCALTNAIVLQDETNLANSDLRLGGFNYTIAPNSYCPEFIYRNSEWHLTQYTPHVQNLNPCAISVAGAIVHTNGWTFPSVNPATTGVTEVSSHRYCFIAFANAAPVDIGGINTHLDDWEGGPILIRYMFSISSGGTNGQDARLVFESGFVSPGDDINASVTFNAGQARVIDIAAGGSANTVYQDSFFITNTNAAKNDLMLIRITRDAGDAADTLAADVKILKVSLIY